MRTWEEYHEQKLNRDYTGWRAEFTGGSSQENPSMLKVIKNAKRPEGWDGCSFVVIDNLGADVVIGFYDCENDQRLGEDEFIVEKDSLFFEA